MLIRPLEPPLQKESPEIINIRLMLAIVSDCAHVIGHYGVGNIYPLQHSVALLAVERNIITKQWKSLFPSLLFPTSNHRFCFSHALLL